MTNEKRYLPIFQLSYKNLQLFNTALDKYSDCGFNLKCYNVEETKKGVSYMDIIPGFTPFSCPT